jgi:exodeoxyribonuclease-3
MDFEGRNLQADFWFGVCYEFILAFWNKYDRLDHKFMFMNDFQNYINDSKKDIQTLLFAAL